MPAARLPLAALWLAQAALAAATVGLLRLCLTDFVSGVVVLLAVVVLAAPAVGPLSETLPRRWLLPGLGIVVALLAAGAVADWTIRLVLAGLCLALLDPVRLGLLRHAALDTRCPTARVVAWSETGAFAAVVILLSLPAFPQEALVVTGVALLGVVASAAARFESDRGLEPPPPGEQPRFAFSRQIGGILADRAAVALLLASACTELLLFVAATAVLAPTLFFADLLPLFFGALLGGLLVGVQCYPERNLGLLPWAAAVLAIILAIGAAAPGAALSWPLGLLLGWAAALAVLSLRSAFLDRVPVYALGSACAVRNAVLAVVLLPLLYIAWPDARTLLAVSAGLALLGAVLAWPLLLRHAFEAGLEWLLVPMYRVRAHGPGKDRLPRHGPVLIVANHASYFDPCWLGKVQPRFLRHMMTSDFYDVPGLRWIVARVFRAIRVARTAFRREAPELAEAIEGLRRGECVVVFPEGRLRRSSDVLLGPFGQGVWRILREVPQTPVMLCWIEGGWGSFASYWNGKPMQGKRPDWRRRIDVVLAEPGPLPPEVLADHATLRDYLRRGCLDCRHWIGLDVPPDAPAPPAEPAPQSNPDSSAV